MDKERQESIHRAGGVALRYRAAAWFLLSSGGWILLSERHHTRTRSEFDKGGMAMMKRLVVAVVLLALAFPVSGFAATSEEAVVADFFVRPLGFVTLVFGTAAFLIALPVSLITGGTENNAEMLVRRPYRFTFERDMGEGLEISEYNSGGMPMSAT